MREDTLAEQIKDQVELVSIPDDWREKFLVQIEA
jgi:hypothetical protein